MCNNFTSSKANKKVIKILVKTTRLIEKELKLKRLPYSLVQKLQGVTFEIYDLLKEER